MKVVNFLIDDGSTGPAPTPGTYRIFFNAFEPKPEYTDCKTKIDDGTYPMFMESYEYGTWNVVQTYPA